MRIIDISQEILSCTVYPDDPHPEAVPLRRMSEGEVYNLTAFSMCTHNGTHVDAPFHFIREGKTIEQLPLDVFVGLCYLVRRHGELNAADAHNILEEAREAGAAEKILIAGDAVVTTEAAEVFAAAKIDLIGVESPSVGPVEAPMAVHLVLLQAGVVLLEGLVLNEVAEGRYFLNAAPLNIAGSDGSPCRAWLMEMPI